MKRTILILALLASCAIANAQTVGREEVQAGINASSDIRTGMSYGEIRKLYDPGQYVREITDPYIPGFSGVCSLFVPGLGQILNEEVGRGFWIMGGSCLLGVVSTVAAESGGDAGAITSLVCLAGIAALDIWSVFDAVKIARIKNMYHQDLRSLSGKADIRISPSVAYVPAGNGMTPAAGLSMRIVF